MFTSSILPIGWSLPPTWDAVAGDYQAADGWIRLHTNAPHHKIAALRVLGLDPIEAADRSSVSAAVSTWQKEELEHAIVKNSGCAAVMYSRDSSTW